MTEKQVLKSMKGMKKKKSSGSRRSDTRTTDNGIRSVGGATHKNKCIKEIVNT